MKQEDKDLLLKDLCARLPYGVKVNVIYSNKNASSFRQRVCIEGVNELNTNIIGLYQCDEIYIRPYLFPLSSMTEEQKEEYCSLQQKVIYNSKGPINSDVMEYVNYCYKNHIDINNLIPKGLAINAAGLNIY